MRYLVSVKYNGSLYHGWAKQGHLKTIQSTIEQSLSALLKVEKINIYSSGRTDAGVHANNQYFHFDLPKTIKITPRQLKIGFNNILPYDIDVNSIKIVDDNFNARFNTINKTYRYIINTGKYDVFLNQVIYQYNKKINIKKMKESSNLFVGKHDFLSFCTEEKENNIRIINYIKVFSKKDNVIIEVNGSGFLRNMVRMIVGSLLAFNEDKIQIDTIKNNLLQPKKGRAIYKAPPSGLYLYKVKY